MRKLFACLMAAVLLLGLTACTGETASLKLGLGADLAFTIGEEMKGKVETIWAAVLVGDDGRIVDCRIDAVSANIAPGAEGVNLTSKNVLKEQYGMVAYAGAEKEWYEQAAIFCDAVKGKTLEQAMNLKAGTEADLTSGCTIDILPLQYALAKAYQNAAPVAASAGDTLAFTLTGAVTPGEESDGYEFQAVAVTKADGKATACAVDMIQGNPKWDALGETADFRTKRELGFDYGMVSFAGAKYEWFEQADALQSAVIGLTASEIIGLAGENGKLRPDVDAASKATIYVGGLLAQIAETMA